MKILAGRRICGVSTVQRYISIDSFPMQLNSILVCDMTVTGSLSARLTVTRNAIEADVWIWACFLRSGDIIANGTTETRLAAQVEAQRAHEAWLSIGFEGKNSSTFRLVFLTTGERFRIISLDGRDQE